MPHCTKVFARVWEPERNTHRAIYCVAPAVWRIDCGLSYDRRRTIVELRCDAHLDNARALRFDVTRIG